MGSGTSRKSDDRLRINRPILGSTAATGGIGGVIPQDINNMCPVTIRVKLARKDIPMGSRLILDGSTLRLASDPNSIVGSVPPRILKILMTCLSLGIKYPAIQVVMDKKGTRHAEFTQ